MSRERSILILGHPGRALAPLADRIRQLGFRAVRAKTPEDAISLIEERGFHFLVTLLDSGLAAIDLARALSELRRRAAAPEMVFVATGGRPDEHECTRLREAGIELALWQPIGDYALLFQLNRACARAQGFAPALRDAMRAPTEWSARLSLGGRSKRAGVYSLSEGGAFLATPRPSPRGARLAIELPLPDQPLCIEARVLYTNVPGNLQQASLPDGMAVRFIDTPEAAHRAIGRSVSETAARYSV